MNPFSLSSISVETLTVPLKEPFITALGRKDATVNVLARVRLRGGAEGTGEAAGSVVAARQGPALLARALRRLGSRFRGSDARRIGPLAGEIWKEAGSTPAAAAAFECAVTGALVRALGVPLHAWFGGAADSIETDITLSAGEPADAARAAARAAREGFRTLKVKAGSPGPGRDLARAVAADLHGRVRGRRPRIVLDGNQRLGEAGSLRLVRDCRRRGLDVVLLEQPLAAGDVEGMRRLRRRCPVPLAADESARSPEDVLRLIRREAADVVNVKVAKTGLKRSLEIVSLARAAGLRLMIGCMQETALGLTPSVALACGTGAFEFADLDSDHLLGPGQPAGGFRREGPRLTLR